MLSVTYWVKLYICLTLLIGVTVIVRVSLLTLAVAIDGLSELTLTEVPGGDTVKLIVVGASLGAPLMLVWDSARIRVPFRGDA